MPYPIDCVIHNFPDASDLPAAFARRLRSGPDKIPWTPEGGLDAWAIFRALTLALEFDVVYTCWFDAAADTPRVVSTASRGPELAVLLQSCASMRTLTVQLVTL